MSTPNPLYREYGKSPIASATDAPAAPDCGDNEGIWATHLRGWVPAAGSEVLDVGCGTGDLLVMLRERGVTNSIGIDLSPVQVAKASARGLQVQLGDALEFMETTDLRFDAIFLMDVLEHIPRDIVLRFLSAIRRSLKPRGCLIGQLPNGESPEVGTILWNDATHIWCYTPGAVRQLLDATGTWQVEFRESMVPPMRLSWAVRWLYWQVKRRFIAIDRCLEHGGGGSGIYSRVFRFRARKL